MSTSSPELAVPLPLVVPTGRRASWRISAILASHGIADFYTAITPATLVLLQARYDLSDGQAAFLLSFGSIVSGFSQPCFAWLSDRFDSRILGAAGLSFTALGMCGLGLAQGFLSLVLIYFLGMLGAGAYHPVAASCVGALTPSRRSAGVGAVFVAGMIGSFLGGYSTPRIVGTVDGFHRLLWLIVPGIVTAVVLQRAVRPIPHRAVPEGATPLPPLQRRQVVCIAVLYVASALRFTANMAMLYLYSRWALWHFSGDVSPGAGLHTAEAAKLTGTLTACTFLGMGLGGVVAGVLVRPGRERWWLIVTPILCAGAIWRFPSSTPPATYLLSSLAGFGFAAMVPVTIAMAQQILPARTGLASGLMLGGAWAMAFLGPLLAAHGLAAWGLEATFAATAATLALSGLVATGVR